MGYSRTSENPSIHYLNLARIALPSILLQSSAPLAITFQTALMGHKSAEIVAAWAIVATATNAATVIFNFLVVGVTAKVSKAIGAQAWREVGSRIRLAIICALSMGLVAATFLQLLRDPIFVLLDAAPEVLDLASKYFTLRVLGVPPQLLAMCTSGILQGYKRVYTVAAIQILRLCVDVLSSYIALYVLDAGIVGVGIGNLLASSLSAIVAGAGIALFPPKEGHGKINVVPQWLKDFVLCKGRSAKKSQSLDPLWEPLLAEESVTQNQAIVRDPEAGKATKADPNGAVDADLEGVEESFWKFAWDGLSTLLRFALVQASFFSVLACVTGLGTHAVAAHQVTMQLWMITVYCADGFATAGTIVGSQLAGQMHVSQSAQEKREALQDLNTMTHRVLQMGGAVGVTLGIVFWIFKKPIMSVFTNDPLTHQILDGIWLFLVLVQPLNAIVFVYDGLIYAAQAFSYMAFCLAGGFFVLFVPTLYVANCYFHTLVAMWFSKAVLNFVRLVVAIYKIHFEFLRPPKVDLIQ